MGPARPKPGENSILAWGPGAVFMAALGTTVFTATNADFQPAGIVDSAVAAGALVAVGSYSKAFIGPPPLRRLVWLGILLLGLLGVRFGFGFTADYHAPSRDCFGLPGFFSSLECLLTLDFSQNYGARQILFHAVAMSVLIGGFGLGAWQMARRGVAEGPLGLLLLLPTFLACVALGGIYGVLSNSLTGINFVHPGTSFSLTVGTAVISNPGWAWPLFAPNLCAGLALTYSRDWRWRVAGGASALLSLLVILGTRQRGGYLLAGALCGCWLAVGCAHRWRRPGPGTLWRNGLFLLAGIAVASSGLALVYTPAFPHLLNALGVPPVKVIASTSLERLQMWRMAWSAFCERPWFGHGYASWLHTIEIVQRQMGLKGLAFPTAHNFWVQALVELGALQALAIFISLALFVRLLVRRGVDVVPRTLAILLVVAAGITSLVQELDHVNTIYYQFAVFTGVALGLSWGPSLARPEGRTVHRGAMGAAFASAAIGALLLCQFSWGGMAFGVLRKSPDDKFARRFRPHGQLVEVTGSDAPFAIYLFAEAPEARNLTIDGLVSDGRSFSVGDEGILLQATPGVIGQPHWYKAARPIAAGQYWWGFSLKYPPLKTSLGVVRQTGLWHWEVDAEGMAAERWTKQDADFFLSAPPHCLKAQLGVYAPRPDVGQGVILQTDLNVEPLKALKIKLGEDGEDLVAQESCGAAVPFKLDWTSAQEHKKLVLPECAGRTPGAWRIRTHTSSAFTPSSQGLPDSRELGVKLASLTCEPMI